MKLKKQSKKEIRTTSNSEDKKKKTSNLRGSLLFLHFEEGLLLSLKTLLEPHAVSELRNQILEDLWSALAVVVSLTLAALKVGFLLLILFLFLFLLLVLLGYLRDGGRGKEVLRLARWRATILRVQEKEKKERDEKEGEKKQAMKDRKRYADNLMIHPSLQVTQENEALTTFCDMFFRRASCCSFARTSCISSSFSFLARSSSPTASHSPSF